jgi:hypothetical protein
MKITFTWAVQINSSLKKSVEEKLDRDLGESKRFKACHAGPLLVSILSTDPLEVSIKGNIKCQCGRAIATFSGASDGSTLRYQLSQAAKSGKPLLTKKGGNA